MLGALLADWSAAVSGPALIGPTEALSWSGLAARIESHRSRLRELGVGDRVVLYLPQEISSVALMVACEREGVDAILVSRLYPIQRVEAAREATGATCILTLHGERIVLEGDHPGGAARSPAPGREPLVGILTSGSTGPPKCAEHTWTSLARAVKRSPRRENKRWLLCYPLSHVAALQVVAQCFVNWSALVIPADFAPESVARAATAHRTDCVSSTPTFMRQLLLRAPGTFWRDCPFEQIVLGGEIVDEAILAKLREAAPSARITHVYATTELGPVIVVGDGREGFEPALLEGGGLKLVDGELFVRRSSSSMAGYFGRDRVVDEWWPTGDLVKVEAGRARFVGRTHDRINVGGYKVSPAEVEAVLRGVEGVQQVCVVGHPSSLAGNLVKAIVQATPGADHARIRGDALARARALLPVHMHPRMFEFVETIPTLIAQKQDRRAGGDGS